MKEKQILIIGGGASGTCITEMLHHRGLSNDFIVMTSDEAHSKGVIQTAEELMKREPIKITALPRFETFIGPNKSGREKRREKRKKDRKSKRK